MKKELVKIIKELTNYEVDVEYCTYGFFYEPDGTIRFTLNDSFYEDEDWRQFLAEKFGFTLTAYNWFTMSILHELGHHYTIEYFDSEEWNEMCDELDSNDSHAINFNHFNQVNELMATEWAIEYYRQNKSEMNHINRKFKKAFKKIKR